MGKTIILRLLDTYFRHRWLYLLPIFLMTILGAIYFFSQKTYYISSGVIFTEQNSLLSSLTSVQNEGISWNTPAQDTTNQIIDLIKTDAFVRAVIQGTDLESEMTKGDEDVRETILEVRKRIWASVAGTNQVQINGANPDPHIAYQLAESTINTFINWKINLDRTDSVTASVFFQDLIQDYQAAVVEAQQALRSYLETHPQPVRGSRPETEQLDIENLRTALSQATKRLDQAMDKAENARLAETQVESNVRQKYTLVDAPDIPDKPAISRRKLAMDAAVFIGAGLILSGIAIVGAMVLERGFRTTLDVQQLLNLPVLAIIPEVASQEKARFLKRKKKAQAPAEPLSPFTKEPGGSRMDVSVAEGIALDEKTNLQQPKPEELVAAQIAGSEMEGSKTSPIEIAYQELDRRGQSRGR